MKVKTVAQAIEALKGYDPNDLIAVNWWFDIDFDEYKDKAQALRLAQEYLENINPEIQEYVEDNYKGESN